MASVLLSPDFTEEFSLPLDSFYKEVDTAQEMYDDYRLLKVTHYKERTLVAHEFLILDMFDGKNLLPLLIERRPSTRREKGPAGSTMQNFSSFVRITDDRISRVSPDYYKESKHRKIAIIRTPPKPIFSLPEISAIFGKISHMAPNYTLLSNQCYWFCDMFLTGVEEKVKVVKIECADYNLRGKFGEAFKVLDDDQVKRDVDAYNERLEREAKEAETEERSLARQAYQQALVNRKKKNERAKKETRAIAKSLLQTTEARQKAEEVALRNMFLGLSTRTAQKRRESQDDSIECQKV